MPEGILVSILWLCPSESAKDQNHCITYAIWLGFFCGAYAISHGFFLRACACWHWFRLAKLMPFGMGWVNYHCKIWRYLCLSKVLRFKGVLKLTHFWCFSHRGEASSAALQNKFSCGGRALSWYHSWQRVFFVLDSVHASPHDNNVAVAVAASAGAVPATQAESGDGAVLGATNTT